MFERPHSVESEQVIIGATLCRPGLALSCDWLNETDFWEPLHGTCWAMMRRQASEDRPVDATTIGQLLDRMAQYAGQANVDYLASLADAASLVVEPEKYARTVSWMARRRVLLDVATELAREAADITDLRDAAEITAMAMPSVQRMAIDPTTKMGVSSAELADQMLANLDKPKPRWSTGIPLLDRSLGDGILAPMVVGFQARPSCFKTGTLGTLAVNAALQGIPTVYIALEMGAERIVQRMAGTIAGFNSAKFRTPGDDARRGLAAVKARLGSTLHLDDQAGITLAGLQALLPQYAVTLGKRVFVVDYWQLVRPATGIDNKRQHLDDTAQWFAEFAKKHGVTVLTAAQLNRSGDTRESDGLLNACDWLGSLHKHETKYHHGQLGLVESLYVDVVKSRDGLADSIGGPGETWLYIHPDGPHLAQLGAQDLRDLRDEF